ncbi:MAG: nucleotide pyrophosphohydrolase [Erysipelotrichaceae bacterium]|nr:nucleotide pyrophosphohydrolase [Erysipelotrichaceae bacterium]
MEDIFELIQAFRVKKGWDKTDTPNVLAKSISVESAELLECFLEEEFDIEHVKGELSDVLMIALTLAMDLNLDVKTLIQTKLLEVDKKYEDK